MREVANVEVRDPDGCVLMVSKDGKTWNFPGGKRKEGETIEETLIREGYEEVGLRFRKLPELVSIQVHPARSGELTRYHIYKTTKDNLVGELRINGEDKIDFFEWIKKPLERDLNPCTRAVLEKTK